MSAGFAFTGTGQVTTGRVTLHGVTVDDQSGATNIVRLYDGTSAAGSLLAAVEVDANGVADVDLPTGRSVRTGIYAVCTGAVKAAAWLA